MAIPDHFVRWHISPDASGSGRYDAEFYPREVNPHIRQVPNLHLRYGRNPNPRHGLPEHWVVKVIPSVNVLDDPPQEIKLARSLGFCAQFVTHYASFRDGLNWYLVMEYCEEGTLQNWLEKYQGQLAHNPQVQKQFKAIVVDIIAGLRILEAIGLVHADLKTTNVGVRMVNGRARGCLLDFGAARNVDMQEENEDPDMNSLIELLDTCCYTLFQGEPLTLIQIWPELHNVRRFLGTDKCNLSLVLEKLNPPKKLGTALISVLEHIDMLESEIFDRDQLHQFKLKFLESINCQGGSYFGPTLCRLFEPMLENKQRFTDLRSDTREAKIVGWRLGAACFGFRIEAKPRRLYIGELSNTVDNQQPKGWGIWLYIDAGKCFRVLGNTQYQAVIGMFGHNPEHIPGSLLPKTLIERGCMAHANCCTSSHEGAEDDIRSLVISSNAPARSVVNGRLREELPDANRFWGEVAANFPVLGRMEYAENNQGLLIYDGHWLDNQWHGQGILTTTNHVSEGEFLEGRFIRGIRINLVDCSIRYGVFAKEGEIMNGVWDHPDFKYEGGIKNDVFQGRGIKLDKLTGQRFEGNFLNGHFHGLGVMTESQKRARSIWAGGQLHRRAQVETICPNWHCLVDLSVNDHPPNYRYGRAHYIGGRNIAGRLVEFEGFFSDHIPQAGRFMFAGEDFESQIVFEGTLALAASWGDSTIEALNGTGKLSEPQKKQILYGTFVNGLLHDVVNDHREFEARLLNETFASRTRKDFLTLRDCSRIEVKEIGSFVEGFFQNGYMEFENPRNPNWHYRFEAPFNGQQAIAAFLLVETATQRPLRAYLGVDTSIDLADLLIEQRDLTVILNDHQATFVGRAALLQQDGQGRKTFGERHVLSGHFVEFELSKRQDSPQVLYDRHYRLAMIGDLVRRGEYEYEFSNGKVIFDLEEEKAFDFAALDLDQCRYLEVKEANYESCDSIELLGCEMHLPMTAEQPAVKWTSEKINLAMESNKEGNPICSLVGKGKLFVRLRHQGELVLRFEGLIKNGEIYPGKKGRYYFIHEIDDCEPNWIYYEGEFANNKPHGEGRVYMYQGNDSVKKYHEQKFENGQPVHSQPAREFIPFRA